MNRILLLLSIFSLLTTIHAACKSIALSHLAVHFSLYSSSQDSKPSPFSYSLFYPNHCPHLQPNHNSYAKPPTQTASATSFCKCICFNNSTIIALNPPKSTTSASPHALRAEAPPEHHLTCTSCNRAFCLSYKLPICADAKEEDVFAQCFQRDSIKDEAVVFIFIFATAGLLGWALLKPWVVKWMGWSRGDQGPREGRYAPLVEEGEGEGEGRDSAQGRERDGRGDG
jgi:hypothetical protein